MQTHYQKDDNSSAFETWKYFHTFSRKEGQSTDNYIMCYEKYKVRMRLFSMDLSEHIHRLNLLCGASLKDVELRIAMHEVDNENPNEMHNQAKKLLKKYYGSSSISNQTKLAATPSVQLIPLKAESFFVSVDEHETYVAWKRYLSNKKNMLINNQ